MHGSDNEVWRRCLKYTDAQRLVCTHCSKSAGIFDYGETFWEISRLQFLIFHPSGSVNLSGQHLFPEQEHNYCPNFHQMCHGCSWSLEGASNRFWWPPDLFSDVTIKPNMSTYTKVESR